MHLAGSLAGRGACKQAAAPTPSSSSSSSSGGRIAVARASLPAHDQATTSHQHHAAPRAQWPGVALAVLAAFSTSPALALEDAAAPPSTSSSSLAGRQAPETVYFGNGCFWGRQYDFVSTEKALGRDVPEVSAVVGYAGGKATGPDGKVCYYLADSKTVYEKLGHAEVVQVAVDGPASDPKAASEFRSFADTYFRQFRKTPMGMMRSDPQDAGPGYRNVVGVPGGVASPFFQILKEANVNGMELREGSGNDAGKTKEDDEFNVVWVVDSSQLPFHRAERYHQFHTGMGKMFPADYLFGMKNKAAALGKIDRTGCPELPF